MVDAEMRCDPDTGDAYFLAPLGEDQLRLVDEIEAASQWMAQRGEEEQNLPTFDAGAYGARSWDFDLDFGASFTRPRAN